MNEQTTPLEEWLSEYDKESTKRVSESRMKAFLEWLGKSDIEIVEDFKKSKDHLEWSKQYGKVLLQYFDYMVNEKKVQRNTAKSVIGTIRAFFVSQTISLKIKKGTMKGNGIALNEHEFTLEELQMMYRVGNLEERTFLSVGLGLGWSSEDFLGLTWETVNPYIDSNLQAPIGFWAIREKEECPCRAHLSHIMIEDLKSLKQTLGEKAKGRIFNMTNTAINKKLNALTKKANIQVRGRVRFHLFRKLLISALANSGTSELHIKLMCGKTVDPSMLTYLKNQTETLREEYGKAEKFITLTGITNHDLPRIEKVEKELNELKAVLKKILFSKPTKEEKDQILKILEGEA